MFCYAAAYPRIGLLLGALLRRLVFCLAAALNYMKLDTTQNSLSYWRTLLRGALLIIQHKGKLLGKSGVFRVRVSQ